MIAAKFVCDRQRLDDQREQRQRTVQVAASRRQLRCYVGTWKKMALLP